MQSSMATEIAQLRAVMMSTMQSVEKLSAEFYGTKKKSKKVSAVNTLNLKIVLIFSVILQ